MGFAWGGFFPGALGLGFMFVDLPCRLLVMMVLWDFRFAACFRVGVGPVSFGWVAFRCQFWFCRDVGLGFWFVV